jgi:hypothetical protein
MQAHHWATTVLAQVTESGTADANEAPRPGRLVIGVAPPSCQLIRWLICGIFPRFVVFGGIVDSDVANGSYFYFYLLSLKVVPDQRLVAGVRSPRPQDLSPIRARGQKPVQTDSCGTYPGKSKNLVLSEPEFDSDVMLLRRRRML